MTSFETSVEQADHWYLTPSHILEYLYCPRFTYYEHVLGVPEYQEKRFKVQKGRAVHEERKRINPDYLRKKLGVVKREHDVELASKTLHLRGKVDEVLTLADSTLAPFDYKYAENKGRIFHNLKIQAALYSLLIREIRQCDVHNAYLCYIRSNYQIVTIPMNESILREAQLILNDCLGVIQTGMYPSATEWTERCPDCCYRNICVK